MSSSSKTPLTFTELPPEESPRIVYFSSASENTHRFVQKLAQPAARIPLHPRKDGMIRVRSPFVLITPTYGGGCRRRAVPKQVIAFLNDETNRSFIRGVITSGNTNFGTDFCIAGAIISAKCQVPELYTTSYWGQTTMWKTSKRAWKNSGGALLLEHLQLFNYATVFSQGPSCPPSANQLEPSAR